ncbi:MAG: ABC transporter permease [Thermoleophilia bacterium]|jgi:ABC-type dipeptide/oligopeptide/nickel transport system permease component
MLTYVVRRVLQIVPVFIGVTILLFLLRSPVLVPGDPVRMLAGERAITPEIRAAVTAKYDLDKPIYVQYYRYMSGLLRGDLGESYQLKRPVETILMEKFPNTLKLAAAAICIEALLGLGAGILSAVKRFSFWDMLVTLSTSILVSLPVFWLGMLLQLMFGVKFKEWGLPYLPVSGIFGTGFSGWVYFILPALTLASVSTAYAARITRSQLLEVMRQDYIRTAAAKGLALGQIIRRHALKNAMIPVITFLGLDLGAMVGGTILTETVFNWPGVGLAMYKAINLRDWPIVTGGVLIIVVIVMVINLLVDISYAFLDPRIRYGRVAR